MSTDKVISVGQQISSYQKVNR